MTFPDVRMRRLRRTEALRGLVRETRLDPAAFILPLFVRSGSGERREIASMRTGRPVPLARFPSEH